MRRRVAIERLTVALDGVPGVSGPDFRDALTRALGRLEIPGDLSEARIATLSLPRIEARPGDTAERLAARAADGIARALREARP